ncbi:SLC13 family permease [Brevundimonas sp.]|uniref:SLC13 family permease n=1 Tax=Brevundimonas sp. TaxID=1871086 RepID=UPI0027316520|nr:SLC13 family permease [Brevundimonas sp.]MDP1912169.1 SLC13 family permease [Brevundimonas sp.]
MDPTGAASAKLRSGLVVGPGQNVFALPARALRSAEQGKQRRGCMDTMAWLTIAVFAITIIVVITNVVDSTVAALIGVSIMIWIGVMTDVDAFGLVDWNVMAILVSVWIIASYFGKTGVPSWLSVQALRLSGGRPGLLVMILSVLSGVISMFVDNVVVILMMAPVALPLARALKLPVTPLVLMIGFAANFMGSAMLLGDLPPQMLHSVAGAEFMDFFWQHGRPSSFPILMVTFVITLAAMYAYGFRGYGRQVVDIERIGIETRIPNKLFATIVVGWFLLTVLGMAMRQTLGVKLGFIAMTGAVTLVLLLELLGDRVKAPDFEEILAELDWRAIFFYVALFALVGGLERMHLLDLLADKLRPIFTESYALGATLMYWLTVPIVGIVEHDAYILTFLRTIKDLQADGVEPWPLWWMLLWSGTLGSNLTVAGAPALYAALNICQREENRKVSLREFLSWSVPFTLVAAAVCYVLGMLIWVLPFVK